MSRLIRIYSVCNTSLIRIVWKGAQNMNTIGFYST